MALTKPCSWALLLSRAACFRNVRRAALCTRAQSHDGDLRAAVLAFEDALPYARAVDLPPSWYTQRSIHSLEMSAIYNARWVGVGSVQRVNSVGSYFTGTMGHEPYLIVNDGASVPKAFYNVCPHRGSLLVRSTCGTASNFACANHGRVYALDGSLLKMAPLDALGAHSASTSVEAGESSERLGRAAIALFGPAVLVHLHEPVDASRRSVSPAMSSNPPTSKVEYSLFQTTQFQAHSNWKLIVEKYLQTGAVNGQRRHHDSYFPDRRSTKPPTSGASVGEADLARSNYSTYIYPNVFIDCSREGMAARYVTPLDVNLCSVTIDYFVFPSSSSSEESKQMGRDFVGRDQVETQECLRACEDVQKCMLSKHAKTLRSSSAVDAKTHEFHVTLADDLKEALRLKFDFTI